MSKKQDTSELDGALLFQEDKCRDDLISIEQFMPKLLKQVQEARHQVGSATCELFIVLARDTLTDMVGLLGAAQGASGKVSALKKSIKFIHDSPHEICGVSIGQETEDA